MRGGFHPQLTTMRGSRLRLCWRLHRRSPPLEQVLAKRLPPSPSAGSRPPWVRTATCGSVHNTKNAFAVTARLVAGAEALVRALVVSE